MMVRFRRPSLCRNPNNGVQQCYGKILSIQTSLTVDLLVTVDLLFFFSSRRRHTRSLCDWSSDVCSSDLTGSRNESAHVDGFIESPRKFGQEFEGVVNWAANNRAAINDSVDQFFGPTEVILDLPHNTFEQLEDGAVVIRKGSVRMLPGDVSVLPSH